MSSCCHAVSFTSEKPLGATVLCALAGLASAACPFQLSGWKMEGKAIS